MGLASAGSSDIRSESGQSIQSTMAEMEFLFPRAVRGGVVIIDDYGDWARSKKAVLEYLMKNDQNFFVNRIDKASKLYAIALI